MSRPAPAHARPYVLDSGHTRCLHFAKHEIQSQMWLADPYALALKYTQTMMGFLLFDSAPAHIGMIGLGGGSLAKFCHRYLPAAQVEVVEINPQVLAVRELFQVPDNDARLCIREGDGAEYVRRARDLDVLLVDGYDRSGLPSPLSTENFYRDCRLALRTGGVLVVNLACAHRQFPLLVARIRQQFRQQCLVVRDSEERNDIVYAWRGAPPEPSEIAPAGLSAEALKSLAAGLDRVRFAWKLAGGLPR